MKEFTGKPKINELSRKMCKSSSLGFINPKPKIPKSNCNIPKVPNVKAKAENNQEEYAKAKGLDQKKFSKEVIIPTLLSYNENMYEPLHHKVDRVFFEARELKEDSNSEFNYQSNKERRLSSRKFEDSIEEKENIIANKLIPSPNKYRASSLLYDGKEEPSSEIPQSRQISRTSMSPITSLVLKSENRKVVIPNQKQGLYQPISILKNRIRPRNPSFPDKCLVSYENLKEKENCKMAKLSRNIHETCQYMLESNNYIKTPKDIDWDKQVEGTDFYERQEKFNIICHTIK